MDQNAYEARILFFRGFRAGSIPRLLKSIPKSDQHVVRRDKNYYYDKY
jgi:hypothetical protein